MTNILDLVAPMVLFDPKITPVPTALLGRDLVIVKASGIMAFGPWAAGCLAWGPKPVIPETVKVRAVEAATQGGIRGRIAKILCEQYGASDLAITDDTRLVCDLQFDSLDDVELSMMLEEEFPIEVNGDDMEDVATVGDLVTMVTEKMGGAA